MDEQPFAGPGDAPLDYDRDLGDPGSFPFTRGIHRDMYAGRPWSIRQYAGYGTAAETNRRFRFLIDQGQAGLSTAFDLPTQMGLDSDDPRAEGEVGGWASRSTPSATWRPCSTASRSTRSRRR